MTYSESGLDVVLKINKKKDLELSQRQALTEFARAYNLARLSLHQPGYQEIIVCFRDPFVLFDGVRVSIDASSFLQVNKAMDEMLSGCLQAMLPAAFKHAADLFCGRGTLSLPLSSKGPVDSFEMDKSALKALLQAAKGFKRPLSTFSRNLFSFPLRREELEKYDVVVLNPPRIGAHAQAKELAKSIVPYVFMVSCNPASFARDARVLIESGYHLNDVTLLDQFLWSPHIETIAVFKRV
jgi:23S rRNA (uracil1939-C5)-methyltransferase